MSSAREYIVYMGVFGTRGLANGRASACRLPCMRNERDALSKRRRTMEQMEDV